MLFRTQPTTLLHIFLDITFNSNVIVKSVIDPDDNIYRDL